MSNSFSSITAPLGRTLDWCTNQPVKCVLSGAVVTAGLLAIDYTFFNSKVADYAIQAALPVLFKDGVVTRVGAGVLGGLSTLVTLAVLNGLINCLCPKKAPSSNSAQEHSQLTQQLQQAREANQSLQRQLAAATKAGPSTPASTESNGSSSSGSSSLAAPFTTAQEAVIEARMQPLREELAAKTRELTQLKAQVGDDPGKPARLLKQAKEWSTLKEQEAETFKAENQAHVEKIQALSEEITQLKANANGQLTKEITRLTQETAQLRKQGASKFLTDENASLRQQLEEANTLKESLGRRFAKKVDDLEQELTRERSQSREPRGRTHASGHEPLLRAESMGPQLARPNPAARRNSISGNGTANGTGIKNISAAPTQVSSKIRDLAATFNSSGSTPPTPDSENKT